MRIAFLGPFGFHPNKTMRSRALPLARQLVQNGQHVTIILPPWQTPEEGGRSWQEDGVDIHHVQVDGGVVAITRRMIAATRRLAPDVIHGFKPKAYSGLALWWLWLTRPAGRRGRRPGEPLLLTDSDDWEGWGGWNNVAPYTLPQKYFFAWQERWGLTHCDRLTVASRTLAELATAQGVRPEKITYLPNGPGIKTAPPSPEKVAALRRELGLERRPVVLLYSRLFEFQTGRLVAVLKAVQASMPNLAILAIGTGLFAADHEELRREMAAVDLLDTVVDVGWLEEEVLPLYIRAADVGLYLMNDTLLNRAKCPVKLADMVSLGLPVVGEAVGQVIEYVQHDRSGFLFPSGETEAIAQGVIDLLRSPSLRARFGEYGRRYFQNHFSWSLLAGRLQTIYETARAMDAAAG